MDEQRAIANIERAIRVIQQSMVMTCVKHVVGNTVYYIEIETKDNDHIEVKQIKQLVENVIKENREEEYLDRAKKLFLELAKSYNDNTIVIKIYDVNECGIKVHYNNLRPSQLIKV